MFSTRTHMLSKVYENYLPSQVCIETVKLFNPDTRSTLNEPTHDLARRMSPTQVDVACYVLPPFLFTSPNSFVSGQTL